MSQYQHTKIIPFSQFSTFQSKSLQFDKNKAYMLIFCVWVYYLRVENSLIYKTLGEINYWFHLRYFSYVTAIMKIGDRLKVI